MSTENSNTPAATAGAPDCARSSLATGSPRHYLELPEWDEAETKHYSGESDPLAELVFHDEPAGNEESALWRERVLAALDDAWIAGRIKMQREHQANKAISLNCNP